MEEDCVLRENNNIKCMEVEYDSAGGQAGLYRYQGGCDYSSPPPMNTFMPPPRGPCFNGPQRYEPNWSSIPPPQHGPPVIGPQQPVMGPQQPMIGPQLPVMGPQQPVMGPQQPVMGSQPPVMECPSPYGSPTNMMSQQGVMVGQGSYASAPTMTTQTMTFLQSLEPGQEIWVQAKTDEGKSYYYHSRTRDTTWTRPDEGPLCKIITQGELEVIVANYHRMQASSQSVVGAGGTAGASLSPGNSQTTVISSTPVVVQTTYITHAPTWHPDARHNGREWQPVHISQDSSYVPAGNMAAAMMSLSSPQDEEEFMHPAAAAAGYPPEMRGTMMSSGPPSSVAESMTDVVNQGSGTWSWGGGTVAPAWPPPPMMPMQQSQHQQMPLHHTQLSQYQMPPPMQAQIPPPIQAQMAQPMQAQMPPPMQAQMPPPIQAQMAQPMQAQMPPPMQAQMPPPIQTQMPPLMQPQTQTQPMQAQQIQPQTFPPQVMQAQQHISQLNMPPPHQLQPHHIQAHQFPNQQDTGHTQTVQVQSRHPLPPPQQQPQQQLQEQTQPQPKPNPLPKRERPLPTIPPELEKRAAEWSTHMSPYGRDYYYHAERKESVWIKPAPLKELDDLKARIASIIETRKKAENADMSIIEVIDVEAHEAERALRKAEKDRKKAERQKIEKEKAEKEKAEKDTSEKMEGEMENQKIENDKLEKDKIEKDKLEKEKIEKDKLEKEKIEKDMLEKDKLEKERLEKEKFEKDKLEKEKIEKDKLEKEKIEKDKLEKEKIKKDKLEKGKTSKNITDKEKAKQDKRKPVSSIHIKSTSWRVVWTGDRRVFFYNSDAHLSVWQRPAELIGRADVDKAVSLPPQVLLETQRREAEAKAALANGDAQKSETESSDSESEQTRTKDSEVATRAAAVEAEVRAARERALVPLEQRVASFRQMLMDQNVSAFSTWEKELHKIVFDERYLLITSKERKQVFDKFVRERVDEQRKGNKTLLQQKKNAFRQLMEEVKLHFKSSFSDFSTRYGKDVRFRGIDKARDREAYFNEYIAEARKREKEDRERRRETIKAEFISLLREKNVDRHARWVDVKKKVEGEARYKAVDGGAAREDHFQEYCRILKEERKREKDAKEKERQLPHLAAAVKRDKKDKDRLKDKKERTTKPGDKLNTSRSDASIVTDEEKKEPTPPPEEWAEIIGVPGDKKRRMDRSALKARLSPKRLRSASHKDTKTKKVTEEGELMEDEESPKKLREVKIELNKSPKKLPEVKIELNKVDLKEKKKKKKVAEKP